MTRSSLMKQQWGHMCIAHHLKQSCDICIRLRFDGPDNQFIMTHVQGVFFEQLLGGRIILQSSSNLYCGAVWILQVRHVWNVSVTSNAPKTLKTPKFLQFGPECTPKQSIVPVTEQETITPRALFSAPASHPTLCESSSVHVVCNDAQQPAVDVVHQHCQAEFPSERHCNSLLKSPAIRVRITRPQGMVKHMTHSHPSQHMVHNNGSQLRRQDNPVVSAEMAEADKLALFLRSPAIRVRKQDPKQQVEKTPVHSSKSLRVRCKVAPVNLVEQAGKIQK